MTAEACLIALLAYLFVRLADTFYLTISAVPPFDIIAHGVLP